MKTTNEKRKRVLELAGGPITAKGTLVADKISADKIPADYVVGALPEGGSHGELGRVLNLAFRQSKDGKGHERHSSGGERGFLDQPIMQIPASKGFLVGLGGLSYQIDKKNGESDRMCERGGKFDCRPLDAAKHEILGLIVYAAAKYLFIEQETAKLLSENKHAPDEFEDDFGEIDTALYDAVRDKM